VIESPCVKVCVLLPDEDVCAGCFRTLEEIAMWSQLGDPERSKVIASLPERRAKREAAAP
jgi:predicted Fe-S protein YdhL (DUF1289 family)